MRNTLYTLLFFLFTTGLYAQAPQAFKYQAVARDNSGQVIANQSIGFRISILQNSPTGTAVYAEAHNIASNNLGLVNLDIGAGTGIAGMFSNIIWGSGTYYIKVEMDAAGGTNYLLMGTSQLLSVPYALNALTATNVLNDNDAQNLSLSGNNLSISNGNSVTLPGGGTAYTAGSGVNIVGNVISNTAPDQVVSLTGAGSSTVTGTYPNFTISSFGTNYTAGSGISLVGTIISNSAPDQVVTLSGNGSTTVTGTYPNFTISSVDNVNDADANPTNEIQSLTLVGNTLSLSGSNSVTLSTGGGSLDQAYDFGGAGAGKTITVDNGPVTLNVSGVSAIGLRSDLSNTGTAIIASSNTAGNTFSAIQASTNSTSNQASAIIGNSSGTAWGVSGQVQSTGLAQAAVYGSNLRTAGGHGVLGIGFNGSVGQTNYSTGYGVYAENFDAVAPLGNGVGAAGKGYYGIVGEDRYLGGQPGAYGVLSNGNLGATGTKTFIIDHPKDPANKVLRHFSVESNEVLNIYRGNSAFDANGETVVELPEYFSDINRNPTYQLTPIGGPGQLYIKKKIEGNRFVIAGGQPGMEVSWQVTAERNDAYMQQNPHQREVEMDKRAGQQGKYFMPQLYGQPAQKGMFYNDVKVEQKELNLQK